MEIHFVNRFLVSLGDYTERRVSLWETSTCALIASTITTQALHFVAWDPQAFNEFITVGDDAAIMFWLVDELTDKTPKLRVQEPKVPEEIIASAAKVSSFKELKIERDRKLLQRNLNKQSFCGR